MMGMRFRKSKKIAPGVKINVGKKGVSVTLGPKGLHHTVSTTGKKTTSVGIPGTGISYVKTTSTNTNDTCEKEHNNKDDNSFPKPKKSRGKKVLMAICVFFIIGVIAVVAGTMFGETPEEFAEKAMSELTEPEGSTVRSDAIHQLAKEQAFSSSGLPHDSVVNGGIKYLKAHSDDFYENNKVMELSMYFGAYITAYLESQNDKITSMSKSDQTLYTAGYQTVKSIKYVYNNTSSKDSEETQKALNKAQKALKKIDV